MTLEFDIQSFAEIAMWEFGAKFKSVALSALTILWWFSRLACDLHQAMQSTVKWKSFGARFEIDVSMQTEAAEGLNFSQPLRRYANSVAEDLKLCYRGTLTNGELRTGSTIGKTPEVSNLVLDFQSISYSLEVLYMLCCVSLLYGFIQQDWTPHCIGYHSTYL